MMRVHSPIFRSGLKECTFGKEIENTMWNKAMSFEDFGEKSVSKSIKRGTDIDIFKHLQLPKSSVEEYCRPLEKSDFWMDEPECEHFEERAVVRSQPLKPEPERAVVRGQLLQPERFEERPAVRAQPQNMQPASRSRKMKMQPLVQTCTKFHGL